MVERIFKVGSLPNGPGGLLQKGRRPQHQQGPCVVVIVNPSGMSVGIYCILMFVKCLVIDGKNESVYLSVGRLAQWL